MTYRIGQKLVCVKRGAWINKLNPIDNTGPKFNEIVTCNGQCKVYDTNIDIVEYPFDLLGNTQSFRKTFFRPLSHHPAKISSEVMERLSGLTVSEEADVKEVGV